MVCTLESKHGSTQESPGKEKALREKLQRELETPSQRESTNDESEGISGKNGDGESRSCPEMNEKPRAVRKETVERPPKSKASAKMLKRGMMLAVVLIIAGVTYHNSHSKGATLQASAVDQVQNTLEDTVGDTVGDTVEDTGGNMPEPQEDNWGKKNTPENPVSASFQRAGHSNDHITTVQNTLDDTVGGY